MASLKSLYHSQSQKGRWIADVRAGLQVHQAHNPQR
jgi:hypothetical protein